MILREKQPRVIQNEGRSSFVLLFVTYHLQAKVVFSKIYFQVPTYLENTAMSLLNNRLMTQDFVSPVSIALFLISSIKICAMCLGVRHRHRHHLGKHRHRKKITLKQYHLKKSQKLH